MKIKFLRNYYCEICAKPIYTNQEIVELTYGSHVNSIFKDFRNDIKKARVHKDCLKPELDSYPSHLIVEKIISRIEEKNEKIDFNGLDYYEEG